MYKYLDQYVVKNRIVVAAAVIFVGYLLVRIIDILLVIFAAYIFMVALGPVVERLENHGLPKIIAVFVPYILLGIMTAVTIIPFTTMIGGQVNTAVNKLVPIITSVTSQLDIPSAGINPGTLLSGAVKLSNGLVQVMLFIIFTLILSIYMFFYLGHLQESIITIIPVKFRKKAKQMISEVELKLGAWLRGQLVLSVVVWAVTLAVLLILGINLALPLSLLAGIMEIVPGIGIVIASVPAVILATENSPFHGIVVLLAYVVIHEVESQLLVPNVMKRAVQLNPIVTIVVILAGDRLLGITGALFAVPFTAMVSAVLPILWTDRQE